MSVDSELAKQETKKYKVEMMVTAHSEDLINKSIVDLVMDGMFVTPIRVDIITVSETVKKNIVLQNKNIRILGIPGSGKMSSMISSKIIEKLELSADNKNIKSRYVEKYGQEG